MHVNQIGCLMFNLKFKIMKKFMVFSKNPGLSPLEIDYFSKGINPQQVEFIGSYQDCKDFIKCDTDEYSDYQCKYDYACGYVN